MVNTALPRYETSDEAADKFKKWDRFPLLDGGAKERADEGDYNHFTILPFCKDNISASVFHYFTV